MAMKQTVSILVVVVLVIGIAGCGVGNKGTMHYNRTTTIGQELIDLQEAKVQGVISEEEYEKLKKKIMKSGSFKIGVLNECEEEELEK